MTHTSKYDGASQTIKKWWKEGKSIAGIGSRVIEALDSYTDEHDNLTSFYNCKCIEKVELEPITQELLASSQEEESGNDSSVEVLISIAPGEKVCLLTGSSTSKSLVELWGKETSVDFKTRSVSTQEVHSNATVTF